MAKTIKAAGIAIAANKANFANMGLASAAEADHVAQILQVLALRPDVAMTVMRLIDNKNITEDK